MKTFQSSSIATLSFLFFRGPSHNKLVRAQTSANDLVVAEDFITCSTEVVAMEESNPDYAIKAKEYSSAQIYETTGPDGVNTLNMIYSPTGRDDFEEACTTAGGNFQFVPKGKVDCKNLADGSGNPVHINIENFANCLPATDACNTIDASKFIDITLQVSGFDCGPPELPLDNNPPNPGGLPEKEDPATLPPEKEEPATTASKATAAPSAASTITLSTMLIGSAAVVLGVSLVFLLSN